MGVVPLSWSKRCTLTVAAQRAVTRVCIPFRITGKLIPMFGSLRQHVRPPAIRVDLATPSIGTVVGAPSRRMWQLWPESRCFMRLLTTQLDGCENKRVECFISAPHGGLTYWKAGSWLRFLRKDPSVKIKTLAYITFVTSILGNHSTA